VRRLRAGGDAGWNDPALDARRAGDGATLAVGTAIATFDENGRYANDTHGKSHAAIYLGQTAAGIQVLDQWLHRRKRSDGTVKVETHVVQERTIYFQPRKVKDVDDGRKYYVIK
jgi:hypothetical protein